MTLQNNHNPIFLIVTHRCGTTWLGSLFDSLDEIAFVYLGFGIKLEGKINFLGR